MGGVGIYPVYDNDDDRGRRSQSRIPNRKTRQGPPFPARRARARAALAAAHARAWPARARGVALPLSIGAAPAVLNWFGVGVNLFLIEDGSPPLISSPLLRSSHPSKTAILHSLEVPPVANTLPLAVSSGLSHAQQLHSIPARRIQFWSETTARLIINIIIP